MKRCRIIPLIILLYIMTVSTLISCLKDKLDYQQNVTNAVKTMSGKYIGTMVSVTNDGKYLDPVDNIKWKVDTTGIKLKEFPLKNLAQGFNTTDDQKVLSALLAADTTSVNLEMLIGNSNLGGQIISFFTRPMATFNLTIDGTKRTYVIDGVETKYEMSGGIYIMQSQSMNFYFRINRMREMLQNQNGTSFQKVKGFKYGMRFNLTSKSVTK